MIPARAFMPVLLAATAAAVAFAAYRHGVDTTEAEWRAKWALQAQQLALAESHATELARTEEKRRQVAIDLVTKNAQTEIDQARADADRARAAADSLRDQAKRLAARAGNACSNPGAASAGHPATGTAMVLADLFGRADQAAGDLAAAYDRARVAGQACQEAYQALRAGEVE